MAIQMTERVFRWEVEGQRAYVGAALHTYQLAFGLTLRWYSGQPHARIYIGPIKFYCGLFAGSARVAFSGGDR